MTKEENKKPSKTDELMTVKNKVIEILYLASDSALKELAISCSKSATI